MKHRVKFIVLLMCMNLAVPPAWSEKAEPDQSVKKMPVEFADEESSQQAGPVTAEDPYAGSGDPFEDFRLFSQRMRSLLDPWMNDMRLGRMSGGLGPAGLGSAVRADVEETLDEYIVTMDLPGYKKDEIQVTLKNDALHVQAQTKGERQEKEELEGRQMISRERHHGVIKRVIRFQQPVKEKGITAKFEDGVLTVHVLKSEPEKSVDIQVI